LSRMEFIQAEQRSASKRTRERKASTGGRASLARRSLETKQYPSLTVCCSSPLELSRRCHARHAICLGYSQCFSYPMAHRLSPFSRGTQTGLRSRLVSASVAMSVFASTLSSRLNKARKAAEAMTLFQTMKTARLTPTEVTYGGEY
jgi:hypothetical protein